MSKRNKARRPPSRTAMTLITVALLTTLATFVATAAYIVSRILIHVFR